MISDIQKEKNDLIIKKSKNGKGVFTKKNFSSGERILKIRGKLITCDVDEDIDEKTRSNTFRYDKDKYLSPSGTMGDYFNHSCDPNSKIIKSKGKLFVVAIKQILKNKEVFFDYSTLLASDDIWEMGCNCGSRNCRGKIKAFCKLPKALREEYLSLGMVPRYILNL